ncbi:hypothetical protein E3N88_05814 [Mikania micrantha]|uniref:ARID domain-containing protein n=1 Tax=Mikania micrantha TaxID=192012 RepID=A0A5N6PM23_9ASTR|nr:hypothetical protein E3N88_05814 [Mikania micrantha]
MKGSFTSEWCEEKQRKPWRPGLQWHQSQRRTKAATKRGVRDKGFGSSACVRKCNRLFKGNQVQGAIKRGDSKPSEGKRKIIQGLAKLRLGNGRRPCNRAVTRGSKQGKVQKSREIMNKALGYVRRRRLNPYRRLKRARCFTCKERDRVFTSCPNKAVGNHVDSNFVLDNENEFVVVGTENMDQEMVIESKENKLNSYLDGHYENLFNKMMNFKGIEDVNGKEKICECVKVNSLSSMVEFLDSLENEILVNNNKETFKICFDNMLKWFYKKQLRLEEELDLPPNLDGYEIEMMHFYLIVKYMGGYEKVTKEERWLDVVDRMGLLVYMQDIKGGIEAAVTVGQFGSKIKNERKWVRRNVSAFRSWPYMCGPSYVNDGSKSFSKELTDDEFEDCEKESIGDNETDSRMEANYMDELKTAGADLKGAVIDPKDADAEPDAAETSLKAGKIKTNTAGALAHAGADMKSTKAGKEAAKDGAGAASENGDSED